MQHDTPDRAKIIELNDQLRTTFKGGRGQMMPRAFQLDARLCGRALCVMSRSAKFDDSSDHDRGRFVFAGYAFEWCVEYRSRDGNGISPNPADLEKTIRVLTLSAIDDLLVRPASGPRTATVAAREASAQRCRAVS